MKKREKKAVVVKVKDANVDARKNARFYLFDEEGHLMETVPLAKGEAMLTSKPEEIEGVTLMMLGPDLPKEFDMSRLNSETLKNMGGTEVSTHLTAKNEIVLSKIPLFKIPPFKFCNITGHLSKNFNIDGVLKELPVCKARVHICEVDRWFLLWPKIPPLILDELADKLKNILRYKKVKRFVFPGPGPGPDPRVIQPGRNIINPLPDGSPAASTFSGNIVLPELSEEIKKGILSTEKATVQATISKNFKLLHPYLCLWPHFWPYFYFSREIATEYSDNEGKFNHIYVNLDSDYDIYIWVEVLINGNWETVYRPPLPCGTWWDYKCGTDIHILLTDPRVTPNCQIPPTGQLVWFRSIGEYATALHIEQDPTHSVNIQGVPFKNVGCTDVLTDVLGNNHQISPFGSTLYFKLLFGDGLPNTGITHFRWRKTQIQDAALNPIASPVTSVVGGTVYKYYYVITTDIFGHQHFETKGSFLGAEGSGTNIGYRIPHWNINNDPGVPAADKLLTIEWTSPDFWSAFLDSNSLSDGLWRFDLELLSRDAAGVFHVVSVPKQVFQVAQANNYWNSVDAPDAYLGLVLAPPPLVVKAKRLSLNVRIDNSVCHADIQDATLTIGGVTQLSGPCGFLQYTDPAHQIVHISFIASHPRNFALFHFRVIKGNETLPITPTLNDDGYVNSSTVLYVLLGGEFSRNVPVTQFLGTTCKQVALSENLYIRSLATNGTRFLWEYDASDVNAFALSNT
jgi:hypothetical protein